MYQKQMTKEAAWSGHLYLIQGERQKSCGHPPFFLCLSFSPPLSRSLSPLPLSVNILRYTIMFNVTPFLYIQNSQLFKPLFMSRGAPTNEYTNKPPPSSIERDNARETTHHGPRTQTNATDRENSDQSREHIHSKKARMSILHEKSKEGCDNSSCPHDDTPLINARPHKLCQRII